MRDSTEARKIYTHNSENESIVVWEQGKLRWMSFDEIMQTVINLSNPTQLVAPFSRAMFASLLFVDTPRRVLLVGMGGGAIARHFHNLDANVMGDVVEWSDDVVRIAKTFFEFPGEDNGWKTYISDARNYIKSTTNKYEMIMVDVAERSQTPDWVSDINCLERFKKILMTNGIVVFNLLVSDGNIFLEFLRNIRKVFDGKTACLSVPDYQNIVVFAFKKASLYSDINELKGRISYLEQKWGMEFGPMLDQLCIDNPHGSGVF